MPPPKKKPAAVRNDNWVSTVTGIGSAAYDKRETYEFEAVDLDDDEVEELWRGDDQAARIIEKPAEEMMREGFELVVSGTEGAEDMAKEVAEEMSNLLDELGLLEKVGEALNYARAFGGGALLIGADDGQKTSKPLDTTRIKTFRWVQTLAPSELEVDSYYDDPAQPKYGEPAVYKIRQNVATELGRRATFVHETRLIRFFGPKTTRARELERDHWGESVINRVWRVVRDFQNAWSGAGVLLADFSPPVMKIKGLAELLAMNNQEVVKNRAMAIELSRSICRMLLLDAEESFERQATPVAGLKELLTEYGVRLSAAAEMPVTVMMGISPAGLNATGASDIRNWYDSIRRKQEKVLRPALNRLLTLLFLAKDGPTKGREPEKWRVEFRPLWQLTEVEAADLRKKQAETDKLYIDAGVLSPEEVAISRWGTGRYSTETVIDWEERERFAKELEAEEEEEATAALEEGETDPATAPGEPQTSAPLERKQVSARKPSAGRRMPAGAG